VIVWGIGFRGLHGVVTFQPPIVITAAEVALLGDLPSESLKTLGEEVLGEEVLGEEVLGEEVR
jgi:hypothetical protein